MSSILTRNRGETGESTQDTESGPLMQVLKVAMEEAGSDASSASRGDKIARAFLVIDVGAAANRLLRGRGAPTEAAEALVESDMDVETDEGGGGRGTLSRLFLLGVVVGLGYVLRSRSGSGSVGEVVDSATERAQTVADETARRSGEIAQRTTAVTGQVADRIEQTGEMAADRIEEGGETAADSIQESGEMATGQIEEATETVEGMEEEATGEGEESEETEE